MSFDPSNYGKLVAPLLSAAPCNELGPGSPSTAYRATLAELRPESLVAPNIVTDRDMAMAAISGLWLRFDFLDESHRISQDLENPTGSYWHGIMHRREPDFGNSKYWFRRVGQHPVFEPLAVEARKIASDAGVGGSAAFLVDQANWDPFDFVDLCQRAHGASDLTELCLKIQQCEWELLFDYCYRRAAG